jgi:general stress protein YciG
VVKFTKESIIECKALLKAVLGTSSSGRLEIDQAFADYYAVKRSTISGIRTGRIHKAETRVSRRGFASMDPAYRKEVSRRGGKKAQNLGVGHRFTPDEARLAGRKGGTGRGKVRQEGKPNA